MVEVPVHILNFTTMVRVQLYSVHARIPTEHGFLDLVQLIYKKEMTLERQIGSRLISTNILSYAEGH